jgi:hypothetical protein
MTRPSHLLLRLLVPLALVAAASCLPAMSWPHAAALVPLAYASLALAEVVATLDARRVVQNGGAVAAAAALGLLWPMLFWVFILIAGPLGPAALLAAIAGTIAGRLVHGLPPDGDLPFDPARTVVAVATTLTLRLAMDAASR